MMVKIETYQKILLDFLKEEAAIKNADTAIENIIVADREGHHYQMLSSGWHQKTFIHDLVYHFDIKPDGKIWIQANWTDQLVAEELIKRGVQQSDIVLGFQPPYLRKYTKYAEA